MSRSMVDPELRTWEVFATTGKYGLPSPAQVVFSCTSDDELRPRYVEVDDAGHAEAERLVAEASREELRELFREARELD